MADVADFRQNVEQTARDRLRASRPLDTQERRVKELLSLGVAVEILALPDNGLLHYGSFISILLPALEDAIIRVVDPAWNGGTAEIEVSLPGSQATEPPAPIVGTFSFTLQPSYYRTGFFNVGVFSQKFLGADGEAIERSWEMEFNQSSVQSIAAPI